MAVTRKMKHKNTDGTIVEVDIGTLAENVTQDSNHRFVTDAEKAAWNGAYEQSTGYTNQKIADLINGAPSTLDTLKEIADAMAENEEVVDALEAAMGTKAPQAELESHTGNSTIHITATERRNWDNKQSTTGDTKDNTVTYTSADAASPTAWTDVALLSSGEKHSSLFAKISTMFKNVRYLYKLLGTGSIPAALGTDIIAALNKLNTNLSALQEQNFFSTTPYFNSGHTTSQAITANGPAYVFFPDTNNAIFQTASSGTGQYFVLKKVGHYRIILHAEIPNNSNGILTLDLKNANNTTVYKSAKGYTRSPLEIDVYNSAASNSYLLSLSSETAGTLYSDARYTWIEVEYMG